MVLERFAYRNCRYFVVWKRKRNLEERRLWLAFCPCVPERITPGQLRFVVDENLGTSLEVRLKIDQLMLDGLAFRL